MASITNAQSVPINWALTGVAGGFTIARFSIRGLMTRWSFTKWSLLDDVFHLLSMVSLIVHGFMNINAINGRAQLAVLLAAKPPTSADDLVAFYHHLWGVNTTSNFFLYSTFWLVKFSFLMFYRHLFDISTAFRRAWWVVLAFTFVTLWVPLGGLFGVCAGATTVADFTYCNGVNAQRSQRLEYTCAIIVVSDLAIMALPLWMLKGLKLRIPQKIGLAFVFSFGLVIVALDILRTVEAVIGNQILYTLLEANFSVIISCLPTFRSILSLNCGRRGSRSGGSNSKKIGVNLCSWSRPTLPKKFSSYNSVTSQPGERKFSRIMDDGRPLRSDVERGNHVPTNSIQYTKSFDVTVGDADPDAIELENRVVGFSRP
ncbi:hypothetical protein MMC13_003819 [Lambiella insularis]|nr:hypothetical protein [Lambiella insularis]